MKIPSLLVAAGLLSGCATAPPAPTALSPLTAEPGRVVGRVVDAETKQPLREFQVRLVERGLAASFTTRDIISTDVIADDGVFRIDPPSEGSFQVVGEAAGYLPGVAPVTFSAAAAAQPVTIELARGVPVTGRVKDPAGNPVAGAEVSVELQSPMLGPISRAATTDASGRFELNVDKGDKTFVIDREGSVEEKVFRRVEEGPVELEIVLMPSQSLTGIVADDTGAPIPSARVRASWADRQGVLVDATTDAAGRFEMAGLRPGTHKVEIAKGGYPRTSVEGVTLPREDELRVEVPRGSTVTGSVTGFGPEEIPYVFVHFGHGVMTGINHEEKYGVLAVPPGPTTVYAEFIGPGVVSRTGSRRVVLENGGRAEVDLAFRNAPVITGLVREEGKPANRAVLELQPIGNPDAPVIRLATDEGRFELTGIEPLSYRVVSEGRELRSDEVLDLSTSKKVEISVGPREMPALPGMPDARIPAPPQS